MKLPESDLAEIQKRVDQGLISVHKHPEQDLFIYNYKTAVQYERLWDEYTRMCRGLILDAEGNVIARPFEKFFNLNEVPETRIENLPPDEIPAFTEKMDGSMGLLYPDKNNRPAITTRGMFDSEQGKWATKWIQSKGLKMDDFKPNFTYIFEIIYSGSRVVVDYGNREELVLVAAIHNEYRGVELFLLEEAQRIGLAHVCEYRYYHSVTDAIEYLKETKGTEKEGLVCRYKNGLRVKMKSEDYMRLHKVVTGLSAKDVWLALKTTGTINSILDVLPDEFYGWVRDVERRLTPQVKHMIAQAESLVDNARAHGTRKGQAECILKHSPSKQVTSIAFAILDNHVDRAKDIAWDAVEPSSDEVFTRGGNAEEDT